MSLAPHTQHLVSGHVTTDLPPGASFGAYCIVNVQSLNKIGQAVLESCVWTFPKFGLLPSSPNIWSRDPRLDPANGFTYGQILIACFQWTARLIRFIDIHWFHKTNHTYLLTYLHCKSGVLTYLSSDLLPNFVEIARTAAEIWRFFDFSRWRPPPSWIFEIWNRRHLFITSACVMCDV